MKKDELMDKIDEMVKILGADETILSLAKAMTSKELEDDLKYIDRMNDLNLFNEDEEN